MDWKIDFKTKYSLLMKIIKSKSTANTLLSNSSLYVYIKPGLLWFLHLVTATSTGYPDYLKIHFEKNKEFITDMSVKLQN